jgi:hypothetical protein
MQTPNVPPSRFLRILLKSLPTTAIAGMAFIAIQHPPSSEASRMILSTVVAISIGLNGWYGPRMWTELSPTASTLPCSPTTPLNDM